MGKTLPLICPQCNSQFERKVKYVNWNKRRGITSFCTKKCSDRYYITSSKVSCLNCGSTFQKTKSNIRTSPNHFCCKSCAATYNNKNKTYGIRRSKLEAYIEDKLKSEFPDLSFIANGKQTIGSELDFYFPDLKLAIEINGPLHYKPIYGEAKLLQIQNNDALKKVACDNANIKFVTVDNLKDCTKPYAEQQWRIIKNILS